MNNDEDQSTVEPIPPTERSGYHIYTVRSPYSGSALNVSVQELLQIIAWTEAHRARLEQEAQEDEERNQRAWEADAADVGRIKREWHAFRTEGDETPPTPPSKLA